MTIICVRDGVVASDTGVWQGDILKAGTATKIHNVLNGVAASTGSIGDAVLFRRWLRVGGDEPKVGEGFAGIYLDVSGRVTHYNENLVPFTYTAPFYAIGAGRDIAFGAMAAGASAEDACRIVIEHSDRAFGDIDVVKIDMENMLRPG